MAAPSRIAARCAQGPEVGVGGEHAAGEPVELAVTGFGLAGQQPAAEDVVDRLAGPPAAYRGGQAGYPVGEPGQGDVLLGREVHRDGPR
jgi:hypothetical protein